MAASSKQKNLIPNSDFQQGRLGQLPEGWHLKAPHQHAAPVFRLARKNGRKTLLAEGNGVDGCLGWLACPFTLEGGKTYRMRVRFRKSARLHPNTSLIFALYEAGEKTRFNNGIFVFRPLDDGSIEGENSFLVPLEGEIQAEARIYFRYTAGEKAWIESISLEEGAPLPERRVKLMATAGNAPDNIEAWAAVLDEAGRQKVDLVLLPETFNSTKFEGMDGPSAKLMSAKAKQYGMYVSGTFHVVDPGDSLEYNACVLYDRKGKVAGVYYKNHPFSPEAFEGVTPGLDVPVFKTDFGKVGAIICYDSWFTDVTHLLALKGAEIVMAPAAGCFMSLMHARSADNCVRMLVSTGNCGTGIFDTTGAEVRNPDADSTRYPQGPETFTEVTVRKAGDLETVSAVLDLARSPSPHNWGGPLASAPGGRRNRADQRRHLWDDIKREHERWWINE